MMKSCMVSGVWCWSKLQCTLNLLSGTVLDVPWSISAFWTHVLASLASQSNSKFATKLAFLASKPYICDYCHTCLNCCQTLNWADNSGRHLLFCSDKQLLHILHHTPFLQLSPWCGIFLNCFLLIPLKNCTVLRCLQYMAWFTAEQHLQFECDLGRCVCLYCIII